MNAQTDNQLMTWRLSPRRWNSYRQYNAKPRIYVWLASETVGESLAGRFQRDKRTYRAFAKAVLAELGIADAKFHWSQKAGCSCGCSPGFVLMSTDRLTEEGSTTAADLHITLNREVLAEAMTPAGAVRLADAIGTDEAIKMIERFQREAAS